MAWIKSSDRLPEDEQKVLYVFYPLSFHDLEDKEPRVFDGKFIDGVFTCYRGFCDWHDAPLWMPKPDFEAMLTGSPR